MASISPMRCGRVEYSFSLFIDEKIFLLQKKKKGIHKVNNKQTNKQNKQTNKHVRTNEQTIQSKRSSRAWDTAGVHGVEANGLSELPEGTSQFPKWTILDECGAARPDGSVSPLSRAKDLLAISCDVAVHLFFFLRRRFHHGGGSKRKNRKTSPSNLPQTSS